MQRLVSPAPDEAKRNVRPLVVGQKITALLFMTIVYLKPFYLAYLENVCLIDFERCINITRDIQKKTMKIHLSRLYQPFFEKNKQL